MMLRPQRVLAVARRDLAQELKGRFGLVLPIITAGLLIPAAALKWPGEETPKETPIILVTGEVPAEVSALQEVEVTNSGASLLFIAPKQDMPLQIRGERIPNLIRQTLDGDHPPPVKIVNVYKEWALPRRSILFAMISASVLTGAISESIAGERSRRTLQTMLTASISRAELVIGKWAAWSAFGALSALVAALIAIAIGRQEPGWWLLPMVMVAPGAVALGHYLVRHAADVVSGSTITLRILPAVLACSGLMAWIAGEYHPLLGAVVPIGGALLAAGSTWPGAMPACVASASTALTCGAFLALTIRDFERLPPVEWATTYSVARILIVVTPIWWAPILGPLLWAKAGNPVLTAALSLDRGILAAAMAATLLVAIHAAQAKNPTRGLGLYLPPTSAVPWAVVAAVGMAPAMCSMGWLPASTPALDGMLFRLNASLMSPTLAGILAVIAQELLFRGWFQKHSGWLASAVTFAIVFTPLDPLRGTAMAMGLGLGTHLS
ncbi:MAG: ABC transporter permease subunit, partial [Proteobacteria bacterium]|nr:ABC transporter permease subunit [Pseudomonadota bacterium]